jgi:hypothetical protein
MMHSGNAGLCLCATPLLTSSLEYKFMAPRSSLLISGLVGIVLAVLVMMVTGWLAAFPTPSAVVRAFNHQSLPLFIFTSLAIGLLTTGSSDRRAHFRKASDGFDDQARPASFSPAQPRAAQPHR